MGATLTGIRLACAAMGTRFEIALEDADAHPAAEAALDEVTLWHNRLSAFESSSVVAHIGRSGGEWVRVDAETFTLLKLCRELWERTGGAFDPTVGPLMEAWGFRGAATDPGAVEAARACTGMHLVELDEPGRRVRLVHPGVRLDLGGIGKGWAIDRALEVLRDAGVRRALIHAGTSSVGAIGRWPIALRLEGGQTRPITLENACLSVSAPRGRVVEGKGHILDPRTGAPAPSRVATAAAIHASASVAEAVSTALVVDPSLEATFTDSLECTTYLERHNADT